MVQIAESVKKIELVHKLTVRQMYQNMVKSGFISDGHMHPGPDMARYENWPDFSRGRISAGLDMISGETLMNT